MAQETSDSPHGLGRARRGPGTSPQAPGTPAHSIDIFPWQEIFDTGLPELDQQHRALVRLLNALANQFAFDPEGELLDRVLGELSDYASLHFRTEEAIWRSCLPEDAETTRHMAGHANFTATIARFQAELAHEPAVACMQQTLGFLARWLVTHILEEDQSFVRTVRGIQAGLTPADARAAAAQMQGTMRMLLGPVLATYEALAVNAANLLREMAERRQAEASLLESEERFRTIVEESPMGIIVGKDGRMVQVNDAAVRMFCYESRAEMLGTDMFAPVTPRCRPNVIERNRRRLHGEPMERMYETVGLRRDGSEFPLMLVPRIIHTSDGPLSLAFFIDLTEPRRAAESERSLHRTVKLLSRCNALLMRAADEQSLLDGVCQLTVEVGGYVVAWVGYAEDDAEQSVRPVAHYGPDRGYVEGIRATWSDTERGRSPIGRAIRTGRSTIAQDIQNTPDLAPWREAARARGFHSGIALPLRVEERTIGILGIYSGNARAFGAEEIALLEELAGDLSFGIEALRLRKAREAAVRELRRESDKNRALLHNASDGVHILNEYGNLIEASDSFCAMLGYTRAQVMGKHLTAWHAGDETPEELEQKWQAVLASSERREYQFRHRRSDGTLIDVEVTTFPLTIEGRRVIFNSSRDVTESRRIRTELEQTTQHLRRLLGEFEAALEAERSHIAREIHDELGQVLTSLGFDIATLRVKHGARDPELMQLARDMTWLNDRALQAVRNVAENLRPAALDMGLVAAIEWLCEKTHAQARARCDFRVIGEFGDMAQSQVDAVFRIAQESLTNVMRHAGAGHASVTLARLDDGLHLTIHDDGRGFDPALTRQRKSFGLGGMEERVRGMGGLFRLTSAPDEGTTVIAEMPYHRKGDTE